MTNSKLTIPETKRLNVAPENWWLKDDSSFLGWRATLVSEGYVLNQKKFPPLRLQRGLEFDTPELSWSLRWVQSVLRKTSNPNEQFQQKNHVKVTLILLFSNLFLVFLVLLWVLLFFSNKTGKYESRSTLKIHFWISRCEQVIKCKACNSVVQTACRTQCSSWSNHGLTFRVGLLNLMRSLGVIRSWLQRWRFEGKPEPTSQIAEYVCWMDTASEDMSGSKQMTYLELNVACIQLHIFNTDGYGL